MRENFSDPGQKSSNKRPEGEWGTQPGTSKLHRESRGGGGGGGARLPAQGTLPAQPSGARGPQPEGRAWLTSHVFYHHVVLFLSQLGGHAQQQLIEVLSALEIRVLWEWEVAETGLMELRRSGSSTTQSVGSSLGLCSQQVDSPLR